METFGSRGSEAPAQSDGPRRDELPSDELAEAMSRWSADDSEPNGHELTDDEWLAHLKGEEPRKSTVDATGSPAPWSAPDRPNAEPAAGTDLPPPLPPPTESPQWTIGPASNAHPVAEQYGRPNRGTKPTWLATSASRHRASRRPA
jgi:hypothetical protein